MKKYGREDQRLMASWAADCAERVLPFFEKAFPNDDRPRKAIDTCRMWVRTGMFKMTVIRGASLSAHAAAREAKENEPAFFAARAAGQAVATAHVPQHAFGGAYYALKAIASADSVNAEVNVAKERDWQAGRLLEHLRQEFLKVVVTQKRGGRIAVKVQKGEDF